MTWLYNEVNKILNDFHISHIKSKVYDKICKFYSNGMIFYSSDYIPLSIEDIIVEVNIKNYNSIDIQVVNKNDFLPAITKNIDDWKYIYEQ